MIKKIFWCKITQYFLSVFTDQLTTVHRSIMLILYHTLYSLNDWLIRVVLIAYRDLNVKDFMKYISRIILIFFSQHVIATAASFRLTFMLEFTFISSRTSMRTVYSSKCMRHCNFDMSTSESLSVRLRNDQRR